MAAKHPNLTTYPSPAARATIGQTTGAANELIEWSANRIERAHRGPIGKLSQKDWQMLATVLNGAVFDGRWGVEVLIASIEDAHRLDGAGTHVYGKNPDSRIGALVERIREAGEFGAIAIATATRYFWDWQDDDRKPIDIRADEWWKPEFRVRREAKE